MAWGYRKSVRLPLGTRVNVSKSGVGVSIGVPGARIGIDSQGRSYHQVSIPGTGIYERRYSSKPGESEGGKWVLFLLVILATFLGGLALVWVVGGNLAGGR